MMANIQSKEKLDMFEYLDDMLLQHRDTYLKFDDVLRTLPGWSPNVAVKGNPNYHALEAAFRKTKNILEQQGLSFDFANGKDARMGFRYPSEVKAPMEQERQAAKKIRQDRLIRLLRSSVNLFPSSWLVNMLGIESSSDHHGEPVVRFDGNLELNRIELFPIFYDAILNHKVLQFSYQPKYRQERVQICFHPYRLKEYDQRWFVLGQSTNMLGRKLEYNICAIDRIVGEVEEMPHMIYKIPKDDMYGESYFNNIIGVTRTNAKLSHIVIQCQNETIAGLINTKPLHHSQSPMSEDALPLFSIDVIPNPEFYELLLSFGDQIKVLSPAKVVTKLKERISKLSKLYI